MESRTREHYAHRVRYSEVLQGVWLGCFEVIDAQCTEFDGCFEHAQRVELVGVDAEGMTEVFGCLVESHCFIDRPRSFFGIRINRDAGVLLIDCGEGFVDGLLNEVRDLGILRVADAGGGGDASGPLLGGECDRLEHFEFIGGGEPVAGFDLAGGGAFSEHRVEADEKVAGEFIGTRFADGADGGHDPATCLEDFEVGRSALFLFPLIEAVPGPAGVGVGVDERWHDNTTLCMNDLGIGGFDSHIAHLGDGAVLDEDRSVVDDGEIGHLLTASWEIAI